MTATGEGAALRTEVLALMEAGGNGQGKARFDALALRVFAFQFEHNTPFSAYCRRRGVTPQGIGHWTEIPPVPTAAFREAALVCGDPARAEAVFRTSGTTRGPERRGIHYLPDLALYHAALLAGFSSSILPEGVRIPMLSLIPPADQMPDSSLAHMIDIVMDRLGDDGSAYFAAVDTGIDHVRLAGALRALTEQGRPVCLLGTSFGFVHWIDRLRAEGEVFRLAEGSRLMDTGGFKGRSREVPGAELRKSYGELLGLDPDFCVNEYGMTELASQFYDNVLQDRIRGRPAVPCHKSAPAWTRVRIVHPETLEPVRQGETGLVQVFDLANLGTVVAVQTEDLGRAMDGGFEVLGRAAAATPRGCSMAMDLLLEAVAEARS